jgi:hypothetical protein
MAPGQSKFPFSSDEIALFSFPLEKCGVLAQLVERLNGIEEVRGSNPLGSISLILKGLQPYANSTGAATFFAARSLYRDRTGRRTTALKTKVQTSPRLPDREPRSDLRFLRGF